MKKEFRLPTLLGLLVASGGLVAGLVLLKSPIGRNIQASVEETPNEVRITNISDSQFSVAWITQKALSGYIRYREGDVPQQTTVSDDRDQEKGTVGSYFTHMVTTKGLKPGTTYVFEIGSEKSVYNLGGEPYKVTTGLQLLEPPQADVAYGQVITDSGDPAEGAIVYLQVDENSPLSALVKSSGSWVIPVSTSRTSDLSKFGIYDKETGKIGVHIEGGSLGTAAVTTTTGNDSPIPPIQLGKVYDYTQSLIDEEATASAQTASKFSTTSLGPATQIAEGEVVILSPQDDEKVNSIRPQIVGRGPAGVELTVEIRSEEPIIQTVKVDTNGDF